MVQLPDITTLITEVQALSARVDAWLDQADATVGGYSQLQADLQALQAQVQQLAGSDGTVAAHTHQISEVQGLAAALAAKLDDAAGVVQQHHIADGAITATKIADGAITAQHISATAPPQIPPSFVSGWMAPSLLSSLYFSTPHGLSTTPFNASMQLRPIAPVAGYSVGEIVQADFDVGSSWGSNLWVSATDVGVALYSSYVVWVNNRAGGGGVWMTPTSTEWEWRLLAW